MYKTTFFKNGEFYNSDITIHTVETDKGTKVSLVINIGDYAPFDNPDSKDVIEIALELLIKHFGDAWVWEKGQEMGLVNPDVHP